MAAKNGGRIDLSALQRFVLQRLQPDGGFAATPMQPHTIQDTFFAVSILRFLARRGLEDHSASLAAGATGRYLRDYSARHPAMPVRTAFQLHRLARHLGIALQVRWRPGRATGAPDYEEIWYRAVLEADRPADPGPFSPGRRTVRQLFYYLRLTRLLHPGRLPPRAGELAGWLRRCQAPDGGFGFFPGTTSYIENCHYALAGLNLLHSAPARPERAAAFLVSCQTASGGFSRNNRAAPFLDASWHAVQAIRYLGRLASPS